MIRHRCFFPFYLPAVRTYDSVTLITEQDRFTVNKNGHQFSIDGQNIHSELLHRL